VRSESPAFAAADWGTTRLRVWLLSRTGDVLAERRSDEGLLAAQPDRFAAILEHHLAAMGAPADLPVIVCGMAGARQGWVEAPYVGVSAALGDIFAASVRVPDLAREVRIVPGLAQRDAAAPDVMRGEETQLAGAGLAEGSHLVCMPGTHSKWVRVEDGVVTAFQTVMTGELFSVLSAHSILRHSTGGEAAGVDPGAPAFRSAVLAALAEPAALETRLFRIRAATLLQGTGEADARAGLSGLLLGAEIAACLQRFGHPDRPIVLVASGALRDLYAAALGLAGLSLSSVDADVAVRRGLECAARHAGLIPSGA
jgi:2-dehydro-3-deoxygalactonokinase